MYLSDWRARTTASAALQSILGLCLDYISEDSTEAVNSKSSDTFESLRSGSY